MHCFLNDELIHFSVDDIIGCFRWLTRNQDKVNSIFDSFVFSFARTMHEVYGVSVTFYCMYTDGFDFQLCDVPDKWKEEFYTNKDWLKFGFHSYTPASNYKNVSAKEFESEYTETISQIKRITGGEQNLTDTLRIHYFAGSREMISVLVNQGIHTLLCADDDRGSYCLDSNAEDILKEKEFYYDNDLKCAFIPTHLRIEKMESVYAYEELLKAEHKPLVIFTHETYLAQEVYRERIRSLFDMLLHLKGAKE